MLITALVFSLAGIFFSDSIAAKMTSDPELRELCQQYLSINLVYCWGIFLQTYGQRLLQAVGDTVLSMISLIIGAILNIILDPIMIFGLLGCPAMGIRGAAIATVIGQMVGAVAALLFNRFKNPVIHVRLKNYHFSWQDVADIYRVGLPTIIMQAIGSVMTFAVNSILLHVSATAVAFFGIYYKLQNFLMMPINGLGQAAIPIVGYNYGAGEHKRVHKIFQDGLILVLVMMAAGTAICLAVPGQLMGLFTANPVTMQAGSVALRVISLGFIASSVSVICSGALEGLGKGVHSLIISLCRYVVVIIPVAFIVSRFMGAVGVWHAFWITEVVTAVIAYVVYRKGVKG